MRYALALLLLGMLAACQGKSDRDHVLNVYAWAEYFPAPLIAEFERATGMHVNVTVLDSPDTVETALSAGSSNYDLVTMNASPHLAREIPQGFWRRLDLSKMPNARNADPEVMKILTRVDPGNAYALPWMWGTVGVIYNVEQVRARIGTLPADPLDLVFDKTLAARMSGCGISVLDSWQDILPLLAHYLGQPALSDEPPALEALTARLGQIKPSLRRIATTGYYEQISNGDLCMAIGYSGDAMIARRMARDGNTRIDVGYAYPAGVVPVFIDALVIPADAKNADGAARFIDFVMQPEHSAEVVRIIGFASGNSAAVPLLDESVRSNPIVYPGPAVRARMETEQIYSPAALRTFGRLWQAFKARQ